MQNDKSQDNTSLEDKIPTEGWLCMSDPEQKIPQRKKERNKK